MNKIPGLLLSEDKLRYEGEVFLSSWKGFQSRNGAYGSQDSENPSNGKCLINAGGDYVDDDWSAEDYHVKAYSFLLENQEAIQKQILVSLMNEYSNLQELYGYEPEEKEEYMPDINNTEGFKKLIGISIIHLINIEKDGCGYVGYEFGCTWDEEHGLGIMTHKDKIIKIGGADSAFLTWIAKQDLENN